MVVCDSSPKGLRHLPIFVASRVGLCTQKMLNKCYLKVPTLTSWHLPGENKRHLHRCNSGWGPAAMRCAVVPEHVLSVQAGRAWGLGRFGRLCRSNGELWLEKEGAAGRASSSCQSRSPPATRGLLGDVVEGAAAESGLPTLALG